VAQRDLAGEKSTGIRALQDAVRISVAAWTWPRMQRAHLSVPSRDLLSLGARLAGENQPAKRDMDALELRVDAPT